MDVSPLAYCIFAVIILTLLYIILITTQHLLRNIGGNKTEYVFGDSIRQIDSHGSMAGKFTSGTSISSNDSQFNASKRKFDEELAQLWLENSKLNREKALMYWELKKCYDAINSFADEETKDKIYKRLESK